MCIIFPGSKQSKVYHNSTQKALEICVIIYIIIMGHVTLTLCYWYFLTISNLGS